MWVNVWFSADSPKPVWLGGLLFATLVLLIAGVVYDLTVTRAWWLKAGAALLAVAGLVATWVERGHTVLVIIGVGLGFASLFGVGGSLWLAHHQHASDATEPPPRPPN